MEAIVQSSPIIHLLFFPCGAFLKEKPRKMFFAGETSSADGRAQRASPSGFPAFALVLFSFTGKKREQIKTKQNKRNRTEQREIARAGRVWYNREKRRKAARGKTGRWKGKRARER